MNRDRLLVLLLSTCLLVTLGLTIPGGIAQQPGEASILPEIREKELILLSIMRAIDQLQEDLKARQAELRSPEAEGRRDELMQQIQNLASRLSSLRENLNEIAGGVDLDTFSTVEATDINWQQKIVELLRPLLNELIRLTARPREIERLRTQIARYQERRRLAEQAVENLEKLRTQITDPTLGGYLHQLQQDWQARRQEISAQLNIAAQQLEQRLGEQQTFSESMKELFQIFFRSRGRNFLLACAAFFATWFLFHRLHGRILQMSLVRHKGRTFSVRLFTVVYTVFTVLGATLGALLVLYLFEDWVLLTLALLFLIGIAWTSKHTLPGFMKEATLLLNLGAVREGERLLYNGVPWLVQALNFHTHLVNPELTGGKVRLPLRDFLDMRSRPFEPGEPWFPTRTNDWVLLDDQTLGKVILQTPEVVRLVLLGGSRRTFSTADFLAQSPTVLSTGFRIAITFGLDYQHQALITRQIPAMLVARLRTDLSREGYEEDILNLKVEFEEAGASSLNLRVIADFAGAAAPHYQILRRAIPRLCVDACNDYGWVIPFTQLTLHMAPAADTASLPGRDGAPQDNEHAH